MFKSTNTNTSDNYIQYQRVFYNLDLQVTPRYFKIGL